MHSEHALGVEQVKVKICNAPAGLLGEGAVQVLYSADDFIQDPILAAVGQLQVRQRTGRSYVTRLQGSF